MENNIAYIKIILQTIQVNYIALTGQFMALKIKHVYKYIYNNKNQFVTYLLTTRPINYLLQECKQTSNYDKLHWNYFTYKILMITHIVNF